MPARKIFRPSSGCVAGSDEPIRAESSDEEGLLPSLVQAVQDMAVSKKPCVSCAGAESDSCQCGRTTAILLLDSMLP